MKQIIAFISVQLLLMTPSFANTGEPLVPLVILFLGSTAVGGALFSYGIGFLVVLLVKCIVFIWKSGFRSVWAILFVTIANVVSTIIGILLAKMLTSMNFMFIGIGVLYAVFLLPAFRLRQFKKFSKISPWLIGFFLCLFTMATVLLLRVMAASMDSPQFYWPLKIIVSILSICLSLVITVIYEETVISQLYKRIKRQAKSFIEPILWCNVVALGVVMLVGAIIALPKRLASPDFLIGAERTIMLLVETGQSEKALEYLERYKAKEVIETFSGMEIAELDSTTGRQIEDLRQLTHQREEIEGAIVNEQVKPENEQDKGKLQTLIKTLAQNEAEMEEVLVDLEINNPDIYSLLAIKPQFFSEEQIKRSIPRGALFLEYYPSDTKLYIFWFSREDLSVKSVAVDKITIDSLVTEFRRIMEFCAARIKRFGRENERIVSWADEASDRYKEEIKPIKDVSMELYDYLVRPVEREIDEADVVIVIPTGSLYYLPFHALAKEEEGEFVFLIEQTKLAYLSSTTLMDVVKKGRKDKELSDILAFGNPDGSLPGASEEVNMIKDIFSSSKILTMKDATETRVKTLPDNYTVLHLATHAILNTHNPKSSYVLLAPDRTAGDDGKLNFGEILRLPLKKKTTLVTLSACQTAVGKNPTGGEVISLTRAFAVAGTPTIVSTLWPVEDKSTMTLMTHFYTNLKTATKIEALREAQLALLKEPQTAHPFFWAPFVLIGDWQ